MSASMALLASPRRREILRLVWDVERPAGEIHRAMGDITFGAVSQQLAGLADAGFVAVRRDGRSRLYRARREALAPVAATLEAMWDDALYRLKLRAELDAHRRGPKIGDSHRFRNDRRKRPRRGGSRKW